MEGKQKGSVGTKSSSIKRIIIEQFDPDHGGDVLQMYEGPFSDDDLLEIISA